MVLGLRTAIYPVSDLEKGKDFYTSVLGIAPYFDEPFYVGFQVGGFELGLLPDGSSSIDGVQAYWGVEDIDEELYRLNTLGGEVIEPVTDVGGGILVAAIRDPFGNRFSIIKNPYFDVANVK